MTGGTSPGWKWDGKRDVYDGLPKRDQRWPLTPDEAAEWLLAAESQDRIGQHLDRYLSRYAGRHFEHFVSKSDPRQFTPWDVLAVESLSVTIPTEVARWLTESDSPEQKKRDFLLAELQQEFARNYQTLWTCDPALLADESPLSELYGMIRSQEDMGYVKTSKLMAAKFPNVVPIRDSLVEKLLGLEKATSWWLDIRKLFKNGGQVLADHLDRFPIPSDGPPVTTLRRLDIILWMEAKARGVRARAK